jgi:hypothetical protein
MAIAAYEGCTFIQWNDVPVATIWWMLQMASRGRWPSYAVFHQQATQSVPEVTENDFQALSRRANTILANTHIALFSLEWRHCIWLELTIVDVNGLGVVRIIGEVPTLNQLTDSREMHMFKCIAISLSGLVSEDAGMEEKGYPDSKGTYLDDVPAVDVTLISEHRSVPHREAIGHVFLVDWVRADRKCETVVLE